MICPACGANLADDLKFCTQCGTALEAAPVVEEPVVEAPVVEAPVVEEPVVEAPVAEAPVVEEPVAEVACDACAFEPEAAQEPVFDAETAPEAFDQLPEEPVEPEQPADKKPMIFGIIAVVLGVLSIPMGCCFAFCGGTPFVIATIAMSIVGIITGKKAGNKIALILSIVGIVLAVLGIIAIIAGSLLGSATSMLASSMYY